MNHRVITHLAPWSAAFVLMLAGASAHAAQDTLDRLRQARQEAEAVSLASSVAAELSSDPDTRDALNAVAQAADTTATLAAAAETATAGALIATGSGATIMHTLAAVGGPVTVAGTTGLGAARLINETLYSHCENQDACDAAKVGTYTGAVVGTGASLAAVAATGAGPAGLAAIGATVGGGMAAGVGLLVAAPVAAAAAVGGLVYWLFSD